MTQHRHLIALLTLSALGPARLTVLLDEFGEPARALEAVRSGRVGHLPFRIGAAKRAGVLARWQDEARALDVDVLADRHRTLGVSVLAPGEPGWPAALLDDPDPPRLLFVRGDPALLDDVAVAVVGTRRCTASGRAVARDLGVDLTGAGVRVVSGLALGVDGAAHRGVLDVGGAPVGVVATGHDIVYPRRHQALWDDVGRHGVLLSEVPLGTGAERWRFPARNRIIAALARLVVVVESGLDGGSMRTVDAAADRGVEVMAVPGPVRAPSSAGTNQLLADGCGVVRDARDVLVALGVPVPASPSRPAPDRDEDDPDDPVLRAIPWVATPLDTIVESCDLPFGTVATRLATLEIQGRVERIDAGYRRIP